MAIIPHILLMVHMFRENPPLCFPDGCQHLRFAILIPVGAHDEVYFTGGGVSLFDALLLV